MTNSYVQYNYSHDNFGSALLAYSSGTWGNNTYRFNVSERDGNGDATYGGSAVTITHSPAQPIKIYNNTFYIDGRPTTGNKKTYALLSNNGSKITLPASSVIGNNIFSITPQTFYGAKVAPYMYFPYGLSGGVINNNIFHSTATTKEWRVGGTAHASLADYRAATGYDTSSKESDPLLVSPGQGGTLSWTPSLGNGPQPEPADYKLNSGSPALGAGMSITNAGARDYYGSALASPVNIGAHAAASQAGNGNEATARPQAGTSFIEHFDGPLDTSFWYISDGYNNGSHQNCQFNKNNVNVANGILSLSITDTPYGDRDYSCGSIQTNQKYAYGTYETRMKVGRASGTNSSLFTYAGPYQGVPQSHEIDFETLGKDTTRTEVNSWVNGDPKGPAIVDLGLDNSEQFVNLAFEWTADKLTFYVNGVAKYSFTGDDVPYEPQLVIPMIWSTDTLTSWMGPFEYPGHPIVTQYSVVSYTAPGDPCQWSGSIVC